jgi:DNA-directed RNA polymerase specialized sigma24 family protein
VWSAAQHLGVPPGAIDDVVQDVFLTAYRRLDSAALRGLAAGLAVRRDPPRRLAIPPRRRRRSSPRRLRRAGPARSNRPPQHRHDSRAAAVDRLLARLSDNTRAGLADDRAARHERPEIASELGLPLNTVYSRLRLAREQLRAQVADDALAQLRDETRRRQDPPERAQQRTWALLVPMFGNNGASVGLVAWLKAQTAVATTLVATGVVATGLIISQPAPSERRAPAAATPVQVATTDSPREVVAPPEPEPAPISTLAPPAPVVDRRLSPRTVPLQVGEARALLAEEIALIDRVHSQLASDEVAAALATISTHTQRFPAGALVDVREAARVDAQCKRGDTAGAEATAQRLLADHPASAVAQRFTNFRCPR